ncbi:DUF3696 domain-containing protein [Pseudenhygromyxa sp. WMMC2535]|uniref:DUF3696 domain-containing protein n=1 Tax=Pseudenhygromyxa sp. WMMC2535 TaxID=2712867 RepID=UPI0015519E20|nr:DUF3696 domain-containing protein [Pseudenhygromyxa sp. WMMC2535]NVB37141.1 DUF3696 domain-containing protein [Pseudenhygromyxa sp. WMMC2535]
MIRELHIVNFKRFRDTRVSFGPLTVLTGANGAGKTSLLHALLMIQRASRSAAPSTVALNDDEGLQLGEGADVLNWQASESRVHFECELDVDEGSRSLSCTFEVPDDRALHLPLIASETAARAFSNKNRGFSYVSAERLGPRDALSASSVGLEHLGVGCFGQYVAQVLAVLDREEVSAGRRTTPPEPNSAPLADLLHQTEWWTSRIVRPIQLNAEWVPNSMITRLRFKTPGIHGEWTRPPNMGFGVSYALPVVVAGLIAPPGGLLIIENPEAHLHPAGQSEIGRFIGRVAADGVQVVVETHSDHVLNGIRHAVANREHPLTADQVQLLFFLAEDDPRGVFMTRTISASGKISDWPEGFFDQFDRDLRALAQLQREQARRRNQERGEQ